MAYIDIRKYGPKKYNITYLLIAPIGPSADKFIPNKLEAVILLHGVNYILSIIINHNRAERNQGVELEKSMGYLH